MLKLNALRYVRNALAISPVKKQNVRFPTHLTNPLVLGLG